VAYEPGDVVTLDEGPSGRFLITRIEDGLMRDIEARQVESGDVGGDFGRSGHRQPGKDAGKGFSPVLHLMDLPLYRDGTGFARAAVAAKPWRRVALSVSPEAENFERRVVLDRPAKIGRLTAPLAAGPAGRIDGGNS